MRSLKKILIVLLVVLAIIQFFRPKRNVSEQKISPNDITAVYTVPTDVQSILSKACNDCHSNNTRYPWYANIQPVAWWLDHHIKEGKRGLNFNEFSTYRIRKQYRRMEDIVDLVKKDEMPLASYTIIHTDAKLSDGEKQALTTWAEKIRDTMQAKYPVDSLIGKKR